MLVTAVFAVHGQEAVFGTTVVIPSGLKGEIYHVPESTRSLSVIETLKPVGSIYTAALNVPAQDFLIGFPGITERFEWFAIDYRGKFWIEKPDVYRFKLNSDDASMLYIDGLLAIDNDGIHAAMAQRQKSSSHLEILRSGVMPIRFHLRPRIGIWTGLFLNESLHQRNAFSAENGALSHFTKSTYRRCKKVFIRSTSASYSSRNLGSVTGFLKPGSTRTWSVETFTQPTTSSRHSIGIA